MGKFMYRTRKGNRTTNGSWWRKPWKWGWSWRKRCRFTRRIIRDIKTREPMEVIPMLRFGLAIAVLTSLSLITLAEMAMAMAIAIAMPIDQPHTNSRWNGTKLLSPSLLYCHDISLSFPSNEINYHFAISFSTLKHMDIHFTFQVLVLLFCIVSIFSKTNENFGNFDPKNLLTGFLSNGHI